MSCYVIRLMVKESLSERWHEGRVFHDNKIAHANKLRQIQSKGREKGGRNNVRKIASGEGPSRLGRSLNVKYDVKLLTVLKR